MASKKQLNSSHKRTSHYYKKKLSSADQDPPKLQTLQKSSTKIQKKPKEPKLRAKEARQRKKFYIQKLQQKILQLEQQIKTYKDKSAFQSFNSAFINLNRPDKPTQTSLQVKSILKKAQTVQYTEQVIKLAGIQNAFRRLYGAVQTKNEDQAQKTIDVLRKRFGVSGQQRVKWFEELMLKIVNIMMPMHCRLLLENCQNRQVFYRLIGCDQSMKEQRKLYFDKETISRLCESRPGMVEIKEQYKRFRIVKSVADLSQEMIKGAIKLQKEIDKIQNSMNPLFVGKILMDLDVERKKTENLNQIFPVNFYKEQVAKKKQKKQPEQQVKSQQEDICYRLIDDDLMADQRIEGFSDEENYLLSILSQ